MNISNISNQLYTTAPDKTGRLPKEMAVYSLLDELSIPYERVDHAVTETMEACENIDKMCIRDSFFYNRFHAMPPYSDFNCFFSGYPLFFL